MLRLPLCKSPEVLRLGLSEPDPLRSAHAQLLAALGSGPPQPLPLWVAASDLEERAEHLRELLGAVSAYLRVLLGDVMLNVPCELDLRSIEALSCDLQSEVTGTMQLAAASIESGRR
jgi:hypothetical protein